MQRHDLQNGPKDECRSIRTAQIVGNCDVPIWGESCEERVRRQIRRLGLDLVEDSDSLDMTRPVLLVRADAVLDERLLIELLKQDKAILEIPEGAEYQALAAVIPPDKLRFGRAYLLATHSNPDHVQASDVRILETSDLVGDYNKTLRKREAPFATRLTASNKQDVEKATFDASYKGVTDFVTKLVWPVPVYHVTRKLAQIGATPNAVTFASLVASILTFFLFLNGYFIAGIVCGWAMAFLDTVDGKLARTTLTSSKFGNAFDHGIDLVAPPLWWFAWWIGLPEYSDGSIMQWSIWVVLGGHIAGKLVEQAFISTFSIKIHIWRETDTNFRQITARRNPNLAILTAFSLFGHPDVGFVGVAFWVSFCLLFHSVNYGMALMERWAGQPVVSWLES